MPSIDPVMQKARSFFPVKTAAHLAEITGYSERAVKYWLAGETKIPSDALAALIRSEYGLQFLAIVMGSARPRWWTWLQRLGVVSRVLRRRQADVKLLREAINADNELTETIARADAASLLQDTESFGESAALLVATIGLPTRTVAAKK